MVNNERLIQALEAGIHLEDEENAPSSCTVDSIVVPRELWERTVGVIKTIRNARKGSCGSIENVYCPGPMNRHGIDNLWDEIQRHSAKGKRPAP